ncbi:hypothetical protein V2J09_022681 [Rumex salicifolius]
MTVVGFSNRRWWTRETTAVVTGANRGIGFEIAKKLAEAGLTVVLTAREESKGVEAVQSLAKQGLKNVHFLLLDVAKPCSISSFVVSFNQQFGVLDILHARTVLSTNFFGVKSLTEALLPLFRRSPLSQSRILNVSSRLGSLHSLSEERIERFVGLFIKDVRNGWWDRQGWPKIWPDYAVSKLALNAYSRMLARRLQGDHIYVNCFCPGFTQTAMTGGKGSRTARVAGEVGAILALLPPNQLKTGKFFTGQQLFLHSKF